MIIVQLLGGLGNQLFQYAAGRRLSLRNNLPLKLDVSGFESYKRRRFALGPFRIFEDLASPEEIRDLRGWAPRLQRRLPRWLQRLVASSHVIESHYHFQADVLDIRRPVYLSGYWQSEKYFADITDVIREDLTFREQATGKNREMLQQIRSGTSVSVHVRRGDYLNTSALHGVCTSEYYRAAMDEVSKRFGDVRFYVFSDDHQWARCNLRSESPISFVEHNGADRDFEDLRLMSTCQHHIIANSTFSWWGAWLGTGRGRIVIAPERWFATPVQDTRDLYPGSWIRM